jgi:hypothetical protein
MAVRGALGCDVRRDAVLVFTRLELLDVDQHVNSFVEGKELRGTRAKNPATLDGLCLVIDQKERVCSRSERMVCRVRM